ncbi:MAG TPA: hypothetical protein VIG30_18090 [Ktedonobacterales bacterium]|jgi:hypothetical protein
MMGAMGGKSGERGRRMLALVGACLCLLLAACSGGATSTAQTGTATATATSGVPGSVTTTATHSPQVTNTPAPTGTVGELGSGDYCASKPNVSATLPSSIPTYPGAQMLLGQVGSNSGVFALCTTDSAQTADNFYAGQLPAHNWQQITNQQVSSSEQLTACMGQCQSTTPTPGTQTTQLSITMEPDTSNGYQTQIVIIYSVS